MMRALALLLLLGACASATPPPEASPVPPPEMLGTCAGPAAAPPAPHPPRTVESIARYATGLDGALVRTETARRDCAGRLARLRAWIEEYLR